MQRILIHIYALATASAFFCMMPASQALAYTNDPLSRPAIWTKVTQSPYDSLIWAQYLGKPWACMSAAEKGQVLSWQKSLLEHKSGASNASVHVDDKKFWGDGIRTQSEMKEDMELKLKEEERVYLQQLETAIMEVPPVMKELIKNMASNFPIIEDMYRDAFMEMGIIYISYQEAHPKGGYNISTWIHEKGEELQLLKKKEYEKLKQKFLSSR